MKYFLKELFCLFVSRVGWVMGLAPVPPLPDERVHICRKIPRVESSLCTITVVWKPGLEELFYFDASAFSVLYLIFKLTW